MPESVTLARLDPRLGRRMQDSTHVDSGGRMGGVLHELGTVRFSASIDLACQVTMSYVKITGAKTE